MVETSYWGPGTWNLLYSIAHECDNENLCRDDFIEFLNVLAKLLPCEECRREFGEYISTNPIKEEEKLKIWINNLHNDVRRRLGKQVISINTIDKKLDPPIIPRKIKPTRNINIQSIGGGRSLHSIPTFTTTTTTSNRSAIVQATRATEPPIAKAPITKVIPASEQSAVKAPARKGCGCGGKR